MFRFIAILLFLFNYINLNLTADYLKERPAFLKPCEIKKPEFKKCLTASVQELFKNIENGIPGFTAIPTFDPLMLKQIQLNEQNSETINVKIDLANILIYGFSKTIVKECKVSSKEYTWKTTIKLPKLSLTSDYSVQGRILVIPLNGSGNMTLEIPNMDIVIYTKTKLYPKGEYSFFDITSAKLNYSLGGFKSHMTNLFNGNKVLEDSTNLFFNENWMQLSEALRPALTDAIQNVLLDILQKLFKYIPGQFFISDLPGPSEL